MRGVRDVSIDKVVTKKTSICSVARDTQIETDEALGPGETPTRKARQLQILSNGSDTLSGV